jgi:hypothetical protein
MFDAEFTEELRPGYNIAPTIYKLTSRGRLPKCLEVRATCGNCRLELRTNFVRSPIAEAN